MSLRSPPNNGMQVTALRAAVDAEDVMRPHIVQEALKGKWMRCLLLVFVLYFVTTPLQAQDTQRLLAAVKGYLEGKGDHDTPMFRQAFTDLDGDGHVDAVVLLSSPAWCGSGGCNMLVFHGTKDGFTFVSSSTITNEPIRVSSEKTSGWRTLIVYSRGKGDVLMRFDGKRYPLNPSTQPKATPAQVSAAQTMIK